MPFTELRLQPRVASNPSTRGAPGARRAQRALQLSCRASSADAATSRRHALGQAMASMAAVMAVRAKPAAATSLMPATDVKVLCDATCAADLEGKAKVSTSSGLEYIDLVEGTGPQPIVGYQVVCNYVAMTPAGRVFDNSLEKGTPYDVRVGTGQVVAGLDEGLLGMKVGGLRRLFIPGNLAFPKGVKAAAGRPSVPPGSPVVFDVQLLYIPGLDDE